MDCVRGTSSLPFSLPSSVQKDLAAKKGKEEENHIRFADEVTLCLKKTEVGRKRRREEREKERREREEREKREERN